MVGGKEYPVGKGKTKKEAKEEAARLVYEEINGSESPEVRTNAHRFYLGLIQVPEGRVWRAQAPL